MFKNNFLSLIYLFCQSLFAEVQGWKAVDAAWNSERKVTLLCLGKRYIINITFHIVELHKPQVYVIEEICTPLSKINVREVDPTPPSSQAALDQPLTHVFWTTQ